MKVGQLVRVISMDAEYDTDEIRHRYLYKIGRIIHVFSCGMAAIHVRFLDGGKLSFDEYELELLQIYGI